MKNLYQIIDIGKTSLWYKKRRKIIGIVGTIEEPIKESPSLKKGYYTVRLTPLKIFKNCIKSKYIYSSCMKIKKLDNPVQ